jgi:hypothetical protein
MYAATVVGLLGRNAVAQSYNDIPEIEVYGQHFFYTNNGTQLCVFRPTPPHAPILNNPASSEV